MDLISSHVPKNTKYEKQFSYRQWVIHQECKSLVKSNSFAFGHQITKNFNCQDLLRIILSFPIIQTQVIQINNILNNNMVRHT